MESGIALLVPALVFLLLDEDPRCAVCVLIIGIITDQFVVLYICKLDWPVNMWTELELCRALCWSLSDAPVCCCEWEPRGSHVGGGSASASRSRVCDGDLAQENIYVNSRFHRMNFIDVFLVNAFDEIWISGIWNLKFSLVLWFHNYILFLVKIWFVYGVWSIAHLYCESLIRWYY